MTPEWKIKDFTKQVALYTHPRSPLVNCVNERQGVPPDYPTSDPTSTTFSRSDTVVEIDEDLYSTKKGQAPKHRNDQREASPTLIKPKSKKEGCNEVSRELTIDGPEGREREEGLAPYPKTLIQRRKWLSHNRSRWVSYRDIPKRVWGTNGIKRRRGLVRRGRAALSSRIEGSLRFCFTHGHREKERGDLQSMLSAKSFVSKCRKFRKDREDDRRGENRNKTSHPAEQRNGVSSSHIFPYQADEVIGGDSVNAIKSRLLAKTPSPSFYEIEQARIDAQDRFEVKVEIIR
ncbi:hypothetical protein RND71_023582 [Anisodus tanguticus]|uniref:DUF8018 domain-containing protein n=1 Tax=Anisodus tanguticus TaxID=243964 RepID=A0AAE1RV43_9SOLA|nr:hypothetical protein RND71_023582 [Anisodus tanguticus]